MKSSTGKMKVTLKSIAEATGFSLSTISRVLNGSDKYSDETRIAVLDAAKKLNYSGIKLQPGQHPRPYLNVVLLTDFHEGEFYSSFFAGYVRAAASMNMRLSLISLDNPREMVIDYIGQASDGYYDAAILFVPELNRDDYASILADLPDHFPIVSNALIETPVLTTITFDGYSGGHVAAAHFQKQGYRRVGVVKGPLEKAESRFRYNGFVDYVRHTADMDLVFEADGDFNFESGVEAFLKYEASEVKPDAIFLSNDLMCHGFLESASHQGYSIPDDVALLGYDDLPMCIHSTPMISSVKTDFERLAKASLQAIKTRYTNPDHQAGILSLIPVNLVARAST
jgi:DNA-binding LacI/PurR family transcriptional regulator